METLRLFDGKVQLLNKLLVAFIRRQVEPVEACVTARQPGVLADLLDAESLRPVAPWWPNRESCVSLKIVHKTRSALLPRVFIAVTIKHWNAL